MPSEAFGIRFGVQPLLGVASRPAGISCLVGTSTPVAGLLSYGSRR
jgi:hypothetical protein